MAKTEAHLPAAEPARAAPVDGSRPRAFLYAAGIYFALALIYYLPAFLPDRHVFGTDYLAGGFFFHEFISEWVSSGQLPKWVPYVYGGLPLFANPGSTYYPFRLLVDLFLEPSRIFPALYVVQTTAAGIGMYLLARELGARVWVAGLMGLAFQFTGILQSAVYAGHEGRMIVASFAPLFFFFLHRGVRTGEIASFVGASATIGFSLLSFQIQSNYYLLLAAALWALFAIWHHGVYRDRGALARRVALGLAAVGLGFALASVNFLPFLDYVDASPRGGEGRGYEYSVSWSMPPGELSSLAVPEYDGILENYQGENPFKLHTEYVGAAVLLLLALGVVVSRRDRRWWFFGALGLFALTIALGGYTPLYRLYYELLPGTARFRAPSISFFLIPFALVAMGALTLEELARRKDALLRASGPARASAGTADPEWLRRASWVLAGVAALAVLMAAMAGAAAGPGERESAMAAGFLRWALFTGFSALVLWLWLRDRARAVTAAALLALLLVADLWIVDRQFFETVPPPDYMFAPDDVAAFLMRQEGQFRVWVVPAGQPYRGGGNYLMRFNIDQAGGEHGNHLQRYGEYVGAGEQTYIDWENLIQHPQFLHAANIRYLISSVPLEVPFLREVHRGSALVYENLGVLPRAYLVPEAVVAPEPDGALAVMQQPGWDPARQAVLYEPPAVELTGGGPAGRAAVAEYSPNRVVVLARAERPGLLVLADNMYEGWHATVNGAPAPVVLANHTFRGVALPAGEHEVVFTYEPEELRTGFLIFATLLALLGGYLALLAVQALRRRDAEPK